MNHRGQPNSTNRHNDEVSLDEIERIGSKKNDQHCSEVAADSTNIASSPDGSVPARAR
jgi:hypothetical protein